MDTIHMSIMIVYLISQLKSYKLNSTIRNHCITNELMEYSGRMDDDVEQLHAQLNCFSNFWAKELLPLLT